MSTNIEEVSNNTGEAPEKRAANNPLVEVPLASLIALLKYNLYDEFKHFREVFETEEPAGNDTFRQWFEASRQWFEAIGENAVQRRHILYNILELATALEDKGIIIYHQQNIPEGGNNVHIQTTESSHHE